MKRVFRYLLLFEENGKRTIAEVDSQEAYEELKAELDAKSVPNELVNERDMEELIYRGATFIDLRE
ncbi:MAG: hypothetical protein G3M78_05655 [Candidatus Nitrohelix vancouverensis]|uniref:Uncharacterized protein n=1 Tax=Candidatus Nitrohelix vancouverensis TaxID=2705534 RepID=A0A7T0G301_9BACT|nr:MAG: hypothetical protein G3M78_05655 [Candidatus Nitrohelix vancouverensis]